MEINLKGRVLEVRESNGNLYVTMNDTEEGGSIQIAMPGNLTVKIDQLLNVSGTIKPGIGKYGQYLKLVKVKPGKEEKVNDN